MPTTRAKAATSATSEVAPQQAPPPRQRRLRNVDVDARNGHVNHNTISGEDESDDDNNKNNKPTRQPRIRIASSQLADANIKMRIPVSSDSEKDVSSTTARGVRATRRGDSRSTSAMGNAAAVTRARGSTRGVRAALDKKVPEDDESDMEEPRWQRVESVSIVNRARNAKDALKRAQVSTGAKEYRPSLLNSDFTSDQKAAISATITRAKSALPMPWSKTRSTLPAESDYPYDLADTKELTDDMECPDSLSFSRLSLTPPPLPAPEPLLLELDDEDYDETAFEAATETSWRMVFDPAHSISTASSHSGRNVPDLTLADLEPESALDQEDVYVQRCRRHEKPFQFADLDRAKAVATDVLDSDEDYSGERDDEDDPFGFSKVERQLQRTKDMRPKLLAINETKSRASVTAVASSRTMHRGWDNANESANESSARNISSGRLDQSVMERAAIRRRGDVKGKGKAVDRGTPPSSSRLGDIDNSDKILHDNTADSMDADLQTAIQLSRGLDVFHGEGCSSNTAPKPTVVATQFYLPSDLPADSTSTLSAEHDHNTQDDTVGKSTALPSTIAGPASKPDLDQHWETDQGLNNITNVDLSLELSDDNDSLEAESTPLFSTPKKQSSSNLLRLSTASSDDRSPLIFERTPQKKPEAGAPLSSFDNSPSNSRSGNVAGGGRLRNKKKKYLLTEQLEALLPRRRRMTQQTAKGRKGARSESEERLEEVDTSSASSLEEDEEEGFVDTLLRKRGRPQKQPAAAKEMNGNKRRRTLAEPKAPALKRDHAAARTSTTATTAAGTTRTSTGSKGKENERKGEDRSGWTESQWKAHEERIKYFQQIDDFELEVEPW